MKKSVFLLLAVVAVFGLAASCGGGGDDDGFNFAGRWAETAIVTESSVPTVRIGSQLADVLIIVQDGSNIRVTYQSVGAELTMVGTCDTRARTFAANGVGTGSILGSAGAISGAAIDDDTMSGTYLFTFPAGYYFSGTWSANLSTRVAQGSPGIGGMKAFILKVPR